MGLLPSVEAEHEEMLDVIGKEHGYRVHHVEPGSPGAVAGLSSILDYIVVANGIRVDQDDGRLVEMITESKDKPLRLCVFNTHTLRTRELTVVPSESWGGQGLLGVTIRFDVLHSPDKHTLHVLDVYQNSPASEAGLDPYNDYVLAVGDLLFSGLNEFNDIIHHNIHRQVRLYVYNAATETVRECTIVPNNRWGGEGVIGCALGAGYLHSLPQSRLRVTRPCLPTATASESVGPTSPAPLGTGALPSPAPSPQAPAPTPLRVAEAPPIAQQAPLERPGDGTETGNIPFTSEPAGAALRQPSAAPSAVGTALSDAPPGTPLQPPPVTVATEVG